MKKLIFVFALLLALTFSAAASGELLVDEADILTAQEEERLRQELESIGREYNLDAAIVTVDSINGWDIEYYTEDYYDQNGYDEDGVILLISMQEREWCIFGSGEGGEIFTSSVIDQLGEKIEDELSDGAYADAFETFIQQCRYHIDGSRNGYPFKAGTAIIVALVLGLLTALITTGVMRGQLKSVRRKYTATDYLKPGSMQVTHAHELYLYSNVSRIRRQQSSSGGSGRSRSIGSGRF